MNFHQLEREIRGRLLRWLPKAQEESERSGKPAIPSLARMLDSHMNLSRTDLLQLVVYLLVPAVRGAKKGGGDA